MDLKEIRESIDKIDKHILTLLDERFKLMPLVKDYKDKNNLPIDDPKREEQLLKRLKELAKEKNIDENFIADLYQLIIAESKNHQRKN